MREKVQKQMPLMDPATDHPQARELEAIDAILKCNLTPGTRQGILRDDKFNTFHEAIKPIESHLQQMIADQRKAEEERSSRRILRRVQSALKEAFLRLPEEEYDWFDIHGGIFKKKPAIFSHVDLYRQALEKTMTLRAMILKMKTNRMAMRSRQKNSLNMPDLCSVCWFHLCPVSSRLINRKNIALYVGIALAGLFWKTLISMGNYGWGWSASRQPY